MKKFVFRIVVYSLGAFLLSFALHVVVQAKTGGGSSNVVIVIEEHPWDVLKKAVKIEVVSINDDNVILLVWFDLEEPPVVIQISRSAYEGGYASSQKRLIKKILSIFLE